MKLAMISMGCIKEDAMQDCLVKKMKEYNITRATSLEEADHLLYITCAGVGDTINKIQKEMMFFDYYTKKSNMKVIVVGCLLLQHPYLFDRYKDNPNMIFIKEKEWVLPIINYLKDMSLETTDIELLYNRTYSLDKNNICLQFMLQEGCNNKCTFCKVHYIDSKLSSVPFSLALSYLTNLVKQGTKIISLNGDNLTLYGIDLYGRQRLHEFIHELSKVEGLEMICLDELVPGNMYKELLDEIITNPKVRNVGMQLETASNKLLKLMNRNYSIEEFDSYAKKILENGIYMDTILMSGFPTETVEDMDLTLKYLEDRKIVDQGVCEYTDFYLIPSSKLEQLSKREKKAHTRYLVDGRNRINYGIFQSELGKQSKFIYKGTFQGYHYFYTEIPQVIVISRSPKYDNLEMGTIIETKPKCFVKHSGITKKATYKI